MARPKKTGLDYFPLDVDLFKDIKIRVLTKKYGIAGVSLYLYCLCEIYRSGFFINTGEDFRECACVDLDITEELFDEMLEFMCRKGLFDSELYRQHGVLSSRDVQLRYQEACRSFRRDIPVDGSLWLLPEAETLAFIKRDVFFAAKLEDNGFYSKNPEKSGNNCTNKSKENQIKANESQSKENQSEIKENESQSKAEQIYEDIHAHELAEDLHKDLLERLPACNSNYDMNGSAAAVNNVCGGNTAASSEGNTAAYSSGNTAETAGNSAKKAPVVTPREELVQRFGESNVREYEQRFRIWKSKQSSVRAGMYPTIAKWLEQDGVRDNTRQDSSHNDGSYFQSISAQQVQNELLRLYAPEDELDRSLWEVRQHQ